MSQLSHKLYSNNKANQSRHPFILPELPYDKKSLEPHMSEKTFEFHHGKHHNAYVQNLNKLLADHSDLAQNDLEQIIMATSQDKNRAGVFNNAAQIWNHTFFWHSMKPNGGKEPVGELLSKIKQDFGSYTKFAEDFKNAGATQFGSGWAWLVYDPAQDRLLVVKTPNAETPITKNQVAIICCDVWEHAYYIDYQNRRPDFLEVFLTSLINWEFAEENFRNVASK